MARELSPFTVRVDYQLHETDPNKDCIVVSQYKRIEDGDNELMDQETFIPSEWGPTCQRRNILYGGSKVLQDRTAEESKEPTRLDSMREVAKRFKEEDAWEKERESSGPTVRDEVQALANIKGVGVADIQRSLRKLDAEMREKVLSSSAVKAEVERMRAEATDATADLDFDDLVNAA